MKALAKSGLAALPLPVKYKPGDRVVALRWPRGGAGVMVKLAKVNPLVRWDGQDEDKRVRLDDIRRETAEDIARRDHELAMRAWHDRRPETSRVRVATAPWGAEIIGSLKTPDEMRHAAAELLLLADWFAERPVRP